MIKNKQVFLFLSLIISGTFVYADHPTVAFGIESSGPISTISAMTAPAGSFGLGLRTEIINNDAFSDEQLENYAASGREGVHSVDRIVSTSLSLSYGVTDNLSVNARLPYIQRDNIREGEVEGGVPEVHIHGDSSGFGDLLLLSQYKVSGSKKFDVALQLGLKAPTGETHEKDNDNVRFETEFQPGSGSWDFLLGTAISKNIKAFGYHANILYNKTTEGSQSTEIGDALTYNAALVYRLGFDDSHDHANHDHAAHDHSKPEIGGVKWDLVIELNGETRNKNQISNVKDDNSGGTTVLLSPGIRVSSGNLGGFISVGTPIIENQNGKQTDIDTRIIAGLSLGI